MSDDTDTGSKDNVTQGSSNAEKELAPTGRPSKWLGIRRMRAWAARKVAEGEAEYHRAAADRAEARIELTRSLARLDNVKIIVDTEVKSLQSKYAEVDKEAARRAELFDMETEAQKADIIARTREAELRAKQAEEAMKPPETPPEPDPIRKGFDDIKEFGNHIREIEDYQTSLIREHGSWDDVPEHKQREIQMMRDFLAHEMENAARREE